MIAINQNIIYNNSIKIKREILRMFEDDMEKNVFSEEDPLDINELASLNHEITDDFINQLQNKISEQVSEDAKLFEEIEEKPAEPEPIPEPEPEPAPVVEEQEKMPEITIIEDDFTKKFKAKQKAKAEAKLEEAPVFVENKEIENLTGGNITEKPVTQEALDYNESLEQLDNNVKYSKYVIYINPENKEFIDSLTVKERKNLINRILREQDDIAITKKRLGVVQTVIKHLIIAIITIAISIPVVYFVINASLEASINNYRQSQSIFKTLYKQNGKIQNRY